MKSKEVAQLLDLISSILKQFPDMEMQTALTVIRQTLLDASFQSASDSAAIERHASPTKPVTPAPTVVQAVISPLPAISQAENVLRELEQVPTEQLHMFLRSSSAWKHKDNLKALAQQLGVLCKSSATKDQLLDLIVGQIEASRAHAAIRNSPSAYAGM